MTNPKQLFDTVPVNPELRLPALAVSRGIGAGRIVFLRGDKQEFLRLDLGPDEVEAELMRFELAIQEAIGTLRELTLAENPSAGIFDVQILIIETSLAEKIKKLISEERVNAEWAIRSVSDGFRERQERVADTAFREKSLDIEDAAERLVAALGGKDDVARSFENRVLAAREFSPSALHGMLSCRPAALIAEHGGWTSHSSILAREFNIPMVSGVRGLEHTAVADDDVIVDGYTGEVIINPDPATREKYLSMTASVSQPINGTSSNGPTTLDGTEIVLRANVDVPEAYTIAMQAGANGIGLFRSESLIRRPGAIPNEDEQVAAYRRIAEVAGGAPVRIRTFDIGPDQMFDQQNAAERNPSLGLRSIRLSLLDPTQFRIQIRALLRASYETQIAIILPMISGVGEIIRAKEIALEERANLVSHGTEIGDPTFGVMIETPAAVLTAKQIATNVEFFCLGTNDLVQYLLAVDRDNDAVAESYQSLHPAVVRAMSEVFEAAKGAGIPVTVCGEMAGSPFYVPVLVGLGAREFSMNVNSIQPIKRLLAGITVPGTLELVELLKNGSTADEIESFARQYYQLNWSGLFPAGILAARHR
ncbi:phosphoenolpyruvate--protein phosphotransferase [soil metagenome]